MKHRGSNSARGNYPPRKHSLPSQENNKKHVVEVIFPRFPHPYHGGSTATGADDCDLKTQPSKLLAAAISTHCAGTFQINSTHNINPSCREPGLLLGYYYTFPDRGEGIGSSWSPPVVGFSPFPYESCRRRLG